MNFKLRHYRAKVPQRLLGSLEVGRGRAEILGFSRQKNPFFRGVGLARSALLYSYRKLSRCRINKVTSSAGSARNRMKRVGLFARYCILGSRLDDVAGVRA